MVLQKKFSIKLSFFDKFIFKRLIDYLLSTIILLISLPLLIIIATAIKVVSPGSVLFRQKRIGIDGKTIEFIKFRTMCMDAEAKLEKYLVTNLTMKQEWERYYTLKNDPRLIPYLGKFLRKTSLDELPNLFNVLLGDISLVGPRPLPIYEHYQLERNFQVLRQTVMPGITGLWQIHRGDHQALTYWDSHYIKNWSLAMDLKILWDTIIRILIAKKDRY